MAREARHNHSTPLFIEMILPAGKWKVYYLGFSKEGWNEHAQTYADLINQSLPQGQSKNASWQVAGIQLFSLADIDRDMIEWS